MVDLDASGVGVPENLDLRDGVVKELVSGVSSIRVGDCDDEVSGGLCIRGGVWFGSSWCDVEGRVGVDATCGIFRRRRFQALPVDGFVRLPLPVSDCDESAPSPPI
jgi:hypothetical protein